MTMFLATVMVWLGVGLLVLLAYVAAIRKSAAHEDVFAYEVERLFADRTHWYVICAGFWAAFLMIRELIEDEGLRGLLQIRLKWPPRSVRWFA